MRNKILLTILIMSSVLSFNNNIFATSIISGTDNTVAPTSTSTFVTGYKNNVDVRDSVVGGTMNIVRGNVDNSGANLVVGSENKVTASSSIVSGWKNKLEGNNAFVGGIEVEAKGDNTFAFGLKAKAIGEGNVAIGKYSNASGKDSMALGRDSIASAKNTNTIISLGNELNSVRNRMSNLDQRVNKVGAATAALAALHPQDFNPNDKFSAAIGFGSYKDANSVAIGAFYRPNENTLLSIGTTMGSEKMFNAGLSLKFGHHDKMNTDTKVAVAKEVQDLARKYEDLSQKYDNLIKLLNKKEVTEFKSDLNNVEENQQYKITRVDNSDTEKGRIERIKTTRK